jgi:hypothetical protein
VARRHNRWLARQVCAAAALVAGLIAPSTARADDATEFEVAKNLYDRADFEAATRRFATMLDPGAPPCATVSNGGCRITDPDFIERSRALIAASYIGLGRRSEAEPYILAIYLDNPGYAPSTAVFSPEVIDRFTEVELRNKDKIRSAQQRRDEAARLQRIQEKEDREYETARVAQLEVMAANETIIHRSSRLVATVPFGVGQFQNEDTALGLTFAISQGLAASLSVVSAVVVDDLSATDLEEAAVPGRDVNTQGLEARREGWVVTNRIAFGVWGFSTVVGVLHAHLTFVPERTTTRPRPIPKRIRPEVRPTAGILPGGAAVGLTGRF